ncbi:CoA transferase [Pseudonocardia nematodicida]|uniref:CoA transferase n=1 Tax=Pseudonocardia nematodicida TaxID=1206997 RepID=A0ABV1KHP5_9PSEU
MTAPDGNTAAPAPAGPLAGLRVIDAGTLAAGPFTATLLGDMGADVIKLEHPVRDDPARAYGPQVDGVGMFWKTLSRNKRCVTLNLGKEQGRELFLRLVERSDVVVENFRGGTFERWGLGWDVLREVNPGLVLLRTSGFGQTGPYSHMPGFGTLAESMSGFAHITGEPDGPPQLPQFPLADGVAAMNGAFGVVSALHARSVNGGHGQWIDNNLCEPLMRLMEIASVEAAQTGVSRMRTGTRLKDTAPRGAYRTAEPGKWIALSGSSSATARRILTAVGRADLANAEHLQDNQGRVAHADVIDAAIGTWMSSQTQADALKVLRDADAPVAPIYDSTEALADPHFTATGVFTDVPDPELGSLTVQRAFPTFSESPGSIRFLGPEKGEHNEEVWLGDVGLDRAAYDDARAAGVI